MNISSYKGDCLATPRECAYTRATPFPCPAGLLNDQLSGVMLVGIEVAVEYWLALSHSPQAQWLRYSEPNSGLLVCGNSHARPLIVEQYMCSVAANYDKVCGCVCIARLARFL